MKKLIFILAVLFAINTAIAQTQNPLLVPTTLTGPTYNLTVDYDSVMLFPGNYTQSAGINGPILSPTLIINKGDVVTINVNNQLNDTTTMHWHGVHLPSMMDGGPHTVIAPNTTWSPTWLAMDHASSMWFHPHLHHKTYKHIMMGVAGMIINRDDDETALALPRTYGVDDIPLVLQTKVMTADYQFDTDMDNRNMDTLFLANATRNAYFDAPAQMVRLRILNGSLMRTFNVGLSNGDDFWVIASDGGLLEAPVQMNQLLIANAERYEILVDLSALQGGSVDLMNFGTNIPARHYGTANLSTTILDYNNNPLNGADFKMLTLNVGAPTANAITTLPTTLVTVNSFDTTNVDVTRNVLMQSVIMGGAGGFNGPYQLNGIPFDMSLINDTIMLGDTEIWSITNQTPIMHPFHIHDIQFNILEINGQLPPAHMAGWKDVVMVPGQMSNVKFITRFDDYADPVIPFMYHCHIIGHEEEGMMGQFIVVETETPTSIETMETDIFSVYPNPTTGVIQINLKNDKYKEVLIMDLSGRVMFERPLTEIKTTIDVSKLSSGIYFVKVQNEILKFVKR
jgi:bilirubin oxidase